MIYAEEADLLNVALFNFTAKDWREANKEHAEKRNLPLKIIKLETMEQAQADPSPATIFSLFYNGKFVTTDLSYSMDSRFDKIVDKQLK